MPDIYFKHRGKGDEIESDGQQQGRPIPPPPPPPEKGDEEDK